MILSTHAVVGGAVASLFPSHPVLVAILGFASHFVIDAIPHWDYPLQSISLKPGSDRTLHLNRGLFFDLFLIGLDAFAGLAAAIWLFAGTGSVAVIALGAVAGMLPDPLQIAYGLYPHQPLRILQRFHVWIHSSRRLTWQLGTSTQALFVVAVAGAAFGLR